MSTDLRWIGQIRRKYSRCSQKTPSWRSIFFFSAPIKENSFEVSPMISINVVLILSRLLNGYLISEETDVQFNEHNVTMELKWHWRCVNRSRLSKTRNTLASVLPISVSATNKHKTNELHEWHCQSSSVDWSIWCTVLSNSLKNLSIYYTARTPSSTNISRRSCLPGGKIRAVYDRLRYRYLSKTD